MRTKKNVLSILLTLAMLAATLLTSGVMAQDDAPPPDAPPDVPDDAPPADEPEAQLSWEYVVEFTPSGPTGGLRAALEAEGLKAAVETIKDGRSRLTVSGSNGLASLREVLYNLSWETSLLAGPADVSISLPVASTNAITLNLDGNISTGYGWVVTEAASGGKSMGSSRAFTFRGGRGNPELNTFSFRPAADGNGALKLAYRQSWEAEVATRKLDIQLAEPALEIDLSNPDAVVVSLPKGSGDNPIADIPLKELPASWDWRTKKIVPAVRDQASCGSCWAFGTVGVMESALTKLKGIKKDLSEQFLISCNTDGWSCSGGLTAHKYHYDTLGTSQTSIGAVLESAKPYTATNGTCTVAYSHPYKLTDWQFVTGSEWTIPTVNEIKSAIYTYGPITAGVCVGSAFQAYPGGIFSTNESCGGYTNHQIILVGWNDSTQSWILRNSWDDTWGESGYMRIKWGTSRVGEGTSWVKTGSTVPNPLTPDGTVYDRTPIYKWSKAGSATNYNLQVYRGSTLVVDQTYTSSVCSGSTCSATPSTILDYAGHKFRVRAKIGGVWKKWSYYMNFTVESPPSGFNSQFNGSMSGWQKKASTNWNVSGTAMYTSGSDSVWASVYYKNARYAHFDYTARVKTDVPGSVLYMVVRAGDELGTDERWYPDYHLGYSTDGDYSIWKVDANQELITIQTWTVSAAINPTGWNTLRVWANGDRIKFYINGTLLKNFKDTMRDKGWVGFQVRGAETGKKYEVDWATLSTLTHMAVNNDEVSPEQEALNEAAIRAWDGKALDYFMDE